MPAHPTLANTTLTPNPTHPSSRQIKILWTFTQLVSKFGFVLDVSFPEPYESFVAALGGINLDMMSIAPFECVAPSTTFMDGLVVTTMIPIGIAAILLALHKYKPTPLRQGSPYFSLFLLLTYLLIVSVSSKICSSFKVDEFDVDDEETRYYLAVDYSIEAPGPGSPCQLDGSGCDHGGSTYLGLQIYAYLMFVVYVIGIPGLYVLLFYRAQRELSVFPEVSLSKLTGEHKHAEFHKLKAFYFSDVALGRGPSVKVVAMLREELLKDTGGPTSPATRRAEADALKTLEGLYKAESARWEELSRTHELSFLFSAYSPRVYWFEVFEVIRRILLSGVLVLFGAGSTVQSAFSILICFGSITVYSVYSPLLDEEANFLQWMAQVQLFLVLLSILLMKADIADDSDADQAYLGWLLIVMTIPGYLTMLWEFVKDWLALGQKAAEELGVSETEMKEMKSVDGSTRENPMRLTETKEAASGGADAGSTDDPGSVVIRGHSSSAMNRPSRRSTIDGSEVSIIRQVAAESSAVVTKKSPAVASSSNEL